MAELIKLTNTREDIKGTSLYFNPDHIICVYNVQTDTGEKTLIYGGNPAQTWEVEETAKQIYNMIHRVVNIDHG